MSILLPGDLPATSQLRSEGVSVEIAERVDTNAPDILNLGLLNLMPEKLATETQIARMLANGPHRVRPLPFVTNAYMARVRDPEYASANTPVDHLRRFYLSFDEVRQQKLDGLIITGAPVEDIPYEDVPYWPEMTEIFDWAKAEIPSVFNICWGAMAALYHHYGVEKEVYTDKVFGIFPHNVDTSSPTTQGMKPVTDVPVSRYAGVQVSAVPDGTPLRILGTSDEAGLCLLEDRTLHQVFMFNHLEYNADTLAKEFERDQSAGKEIILPKYYFPDDQPSCLPDPHWHANGYQLYQNWLNEVASLKRD